MAHVTYVLCFLAFQEGLDTSCYSLALQVVYIVGVFFMAVASSYGIAAIVTPRGSELPGCNQLISVTTRTPGVHHPRNGQLSLCMSVCPSICCWDVELPILCGIEYWPTIQTWIMHALAKPSRSRATVNKSVFLFPRMQHPKLQLFGCKKPSDHVHSCRFYHFHNHVRIIWERGWGNSPALLCTQKKKSTQTLFVFSSRISSHDKLIFSL